LQAIPATVISRDPEGIQRFLVIDRGSNDGIEEGMAVVSPDFFVGQIMDVEPNRSRIILSIDVSYQIGGVA
jgi:rod shape-determining protein MreC